jgi:hypothetical protein
MELLGKTIAFVFVEVVEGGVLGREFLLHFYEPTSTVLDVLEGLFRPQELVDLI